MSGGTDGELPRSWVKVPLREVVTKLVDGSHNPPPKQDSGLPMLSARNIVNNQIVFEEYRSIASKDFVREHSRTKVSPGDVLLTIVGTIGRSAVVPVGAQPFALQRSVAVLTPNGVLPKFLMYQLQAPTIQHYFEVTARGTAQKGVYLKTLSETSISVAPLSQQERIVAELEKQFSRLDEAVALLKRAKANLKRYKAAVLKAAVKGKLTEDWRKQHPDVEPARKLLERILIERRAKWQGKGKYSEPVESDTDSLPILPKGWIWAQLEAISDAAGGFAFESKKFTSTGYQVLKMANIRMGRIDLGQKPSFVQDVEDNVIAKYGLLDDDLVVTLTGTRKKRDYGYVAVVRNAKRLLLNQRIARLRPADGVVPGYLALAMQDVDYRNRFFAYETGNVGQGNVGMGAITKVPVKLPPFLEQKQIIAEVECRLSVIDELEATVEVNLTRADRLRQSILSKAFSGDLISRATGLA